MRISTPFHYNISYRRFRENASFEIEELSKGEAPVAVRTSTEEFRWYNGNFYRQVGSPRRFFSEHIDGKTEAELLEYAFTRYLEQRDYNSHDDVSAYMHTRKKNEDRIFSEKRYPEYAQHAKRLRAQEQIEAFSRDAKAIDQELWIRCGEPCLVITNSLLITIGCESASGEQPIFGDYDVTPGWNTSRYRRLDAAESVLETLSAFGKEGRTVPYFELLMPEVLARDDAREALYGVAVALTSPTSAEWTALSERLTTGEELTKIEELQALVRDDGVKPLRLLKTGEFDQIYDCAAKLSEHFERGEIFRVTIDMALEESDRQMGHLFTAGNIPGLR